MTDSAGVTRVLVSGATGFIGRELVRALLERGFGVRALVRSAARAHQRLPAQVELHVGDLGDAGSLRGAADRVHVVFHLGAATSGGWPEQRRATVEGTRNLLAECARAGARRVVHVSSVAVYEPLACRDGERLDEGAALVEARQELGPYTLTKSEAERLASEASLDLTIVRPGLVYGPGHTMFEHLGKPFRGRLLAYGSRGQLLPLVSVWSVVDALLRIAVQPQTIGRTYNVVDEEQTDRGSYLALLKEIGGGDYPVTYLPVAPMAAAFDAVRGLRRIPGLGRLPNIHGAKLRARALSLRYACDALKRDTGWAPSSLREGLSRAVAAEPSALYPWRKLRVGIIGAGMNAAYHLRALARTPGVEVVGVLDAEPARARSLCESFGLSGRAHGEAEAFWREARPEVVHVVTPPRSHCELVLEALERGAHVLCEKPLAYLGEECEKMIRAASLHGRVLAVNHNLHFDPRVARARRMVRAGVVGELIHVETVCGFELRRGSEGMLAESRVTWLKGLPGGLLEDVAPHTLYTTLGFVGRDAALQYRRVRASGHAPHGLPDELRVSLASERVTANVTLSLSMRPAEFTITVYGSRGTLKVDVQNMLLVQAKPRGGPKAAARALNLLSGSTSTVAQVGRNAAAVASRRATIPGDMTPLIRAFYAAVAAGEPFEADAIAGRDVVALLREIWPDREQRLLLGETG